MNTENPFKIEKNVPIEAPGNSTSGFLYKAMMQMEVSRTDALFIPEKEVPQKGTATALVSATAKKLRELPGATQVAFKSKSVFDESGKYLGLRVWRIN